jgi:hypothetical protein
MTIRIGTTKGSGDRRTAMKRRAQRGFSEIEARGVIDGGTK